MSFRQEFDGSEAAQFNTIVTGMKTSFTPFTIFIVSCYWHIKGFQMNPSTYLGKRSTLVMVVYIIALIMIFFGSSEYICRKKGIQPWKVEKLNITVTPGGTFFVGHTTLGYTHLPGQFKVILADGYFFIVTHRENTLRITHFLETDIMQPPKPAISIFGCSFTHGWSLNNQETYPWLLQERLPSYEIVNFGVSGYGTLHSFIQFQEVLSKYVFPKIAILAYASFHDERNTFLRKRRKVLFSANFLGSQNQPYARLRGETLQTAIDKVLYRPFPSMQYSAFSHFLEQRYDSVEDLFYHSHDVTKAIIAEFVKLAKTYGVQFVVTQLTGDNATDDMIEYAQNLRTITGDMSVNYSVPGNTNSPHDKHPSAQANIHYAEKLFALLNGHRLVQN